MNPAKIVERLKAEPFVPIRMFLSDGSFHDIPHPEVAFVSRFEVLVAVDLDADGVARDTVRCDPFHVTRIEPIPGAE